MTICSPKCGGRMRPLILLILPLAIGCGGQDKSAVSGKVTYQGKPVPAGFVTFVVEKGGPLYTEIQSDGSYRMANVPLGPVKISVRPKVRPEEAEVPSSSPRNPQDAVKFKDAMMRKRAPIPPKYHDPNQSGLTYTVMKGPQQHDIDLK